jgi:adenosylcobinamide-phosphate synthase
MNLPLNDAAIVLPCAALLDFLIGDPWNLLHPVQVMGWAIDRYTDLVFEHRVFKLLQRLRLLRLVGVGLAIVVIGSSGWIGWLLVWGAMAIHPLIGLGVQIVLLASCLAGRSLRTAAEQVLQPLTVGDLVAARSQLNRYVGRDTENLSAAEIFRAVLETVTENATDGVMAPLFWAIVGAFSPLGSVPLALAYKAASTLDSMVGYRTAPYTELGWFSARLEDGLTWMPCRLMVLTLSLLSGQPQHVWRLCCRDAPQDPSPNAGWSECAYAAILGVQVGGTNSYRGVVKHKPLLGDPIYPIACPQIQQAMRLTQFSFLVWLGIAIVVLSL